MKWYQSATSYVSLKWIGELVDSVSCPIPPFTMITDEDKTVVYTITGYIPTTSNEDFSVGKVDLPQNGTTVNIKCIQGIAVKYDINGDTVITPQHLDSENRIYFNVSNIAQNGIFITNTGSSTNYGQWKQKDNLLIEDFGNYYYKFGITADGTSCYLEFPEDCEQLMKDGIEITYIRSDGQYGNIIPNQLSNFYSDLTVTNSIGESVVLNSQNVKITNYFATTNGKDYENIDDAYKNYKRVVGTFETLVTLRDYFNYIVSHNLASNGFVCDRSNDIQNVYDIMSYSNGVNQLHSVIEEDSNDDPLLTAFSIKLYLTKYFQDVSTISAYNGTFQPLTNMDAENVQAYIEDIKSLQHDFVALESPDDTFSHFCYFKNKYPILCKIIPQYSVSTAQKNEIIKNIKTALYYYLNAKEIEFGDKIQDDYLYKIISEADNRIKNVILDNINYTTYAVYYDKPIDAPGVFYEIPVSGDIADSCTVESIYNISADVIKVNATTFINKLYSTGVLTSYAPISFKYDGTNSVWKIGSTSVTLSQYGITISNYSPVNNDEFSVRISRQTQFRNEIRAKSMLAGVTPLLIHEEQFDFQMNQSYTSNPPATTDVPPVTVSPVIDNIVSIYPKTTITVSSSAGNLNEGTYQLRANESIQLYAPNLLSQETFNNYVKFECNFTNTIQPDTYYKLQANEYIVFYWKASSSDQIYSYAMYGEGQIIKSSFALDTNASTQTTSDLVSILYDVALNLQPKVLTNNYTALNYSQSEEIAALRDPSNILSDNKEIIRYIINNVTITNTMYCYWVLNETSGSQDEQTYTLFEDDETTRILDTGEYFFYTNKEMTNLITLGEGTMITRADTTSPDSWTVSAISLTEITLSGIDAITGLWYRPQTTLTITEEQFYMINPGYVFILKKKDTSNPSSWSAIISNTETTFSDSLSYADFYIQYKTSENSTSVISVPDLDLGAENNWSGKSLLGLSISRTMSQKLELNQSVLVTQVDGTEILIQGANMSGTSPNPVSQPVVLLADHELQTTGSIETPTIYYNNYYEPTYLGLYVFAQQQTRTDIVVYGTSGCSIPIKKNNSASETSKPMIFSLPPGSYVVPVSLPEIDGVYYTVSGGTSGTTALKPLYNSTMTHLSGGKLYPLVVTSSNATIKQKLIIRLYNSSDDTAYTTTEDITVQLFNPLKYVPTDDLNKLIAYIRMFDPKDEFNYIYEVDPDVLIQDPLEAKQFLNSNHVYNKFTICQLDTSSNTKIQVS